MTIFNIIIENFISNIKKEPKGYGVIKVCIFSSLITAIILILMAVVSIASIKVGIVFSFIMIIVLMALQFAFKLANIITIKRFDERGTFFTFKEIIGYIKEKFVHIFKFFMFLILMIIISIIVFMLSLLLSISVMPPFLGTLLSLLSIAFLFIFLSYVSDVICYKFYREEEFRNIKQCFKDLPFQRSISVLHIRILISVLLFILTLVPIISFFSLVISALVNVYLNYTIYTYWANKEIGVSK